MTGGASELLENGLKTLGMPQPAGVRRKLLDFARLVLAENQRTNLTGARDEASLVSEHLLDSLAPLRLVRLVSPVADIGSGAGFPGIPAAIAYPDKKFVLLEPRSKRAQFLMHAAKELELGNVTVLKASAGSPKAAGIARAARTVLMRAVAEPGRALRLGLFLVRPGGTLLLYEGRASRPTPDQREIASRAGGTITVRQVSVPGLEAVRHVWIVRKRDAVQG